MKYITFSFLIGVSLSSLLISQWSLSATVRVAFLEIRKPDGSLLRYSQDGRFTHSAISYQDGWLQAYPYYGVQKITLEQLQHIGRIGEIIEIPELPELTEEQVRPYLGKPFDLHYSWSDDEIYCAELIAKILNIKPEPMKFDPQYWPPSYQRLDGQPGISPDRLYKILRKRSYSR